MKQIKYLAMMAFAAMAMGSCSSDEDEEPFDPNKPRITGFELDYSEITLQGKTAMSALVPVPAVMYDNTKVIYAYKTLSYSYSDSSVKFEKSTHSILFKQEDLGELYADSLVFSEDSTSFTANAYYHRTGKEEEIPAIIYSYDIVDGRPVQIAMTFTHPEFGKVEYVFYEEKEEKE